MLHRQIMFKQLQAMQQQYLNQFTPPDKPISPVLQNGMPMQDASQMFMGGNTQLPQHVQGFQNGYVFSQGQNQPVYSMGFSQQVDMAAYGNDMNSFSQVQGAFRDPANAMNMGSNTQLEMPLMQQSIPSNSFGNEQLNAADGSFSPKSFGNKNFGQPFMQASESDLAHKNSSLMVSAIGQDQGGWPLQTADKTARFEASHSTDSLDPLEAKILFNTDDSSWGSSICQQSNVVAEGNLFNSGSWSALMQSAVAEASSSDTGQQEEWSGLTYQNPELSADNDHANYIGNSQSWVDNNLQNISSPPLNTEAHFQNSNMNYSFPSFQETNHQVAMHKGGIQSDFSQESMQQPQKNVNNWVGSNNSQQKLPGEECQLVQTSPQPHNVWNDRPPQHISSYTTGSLSNNSMKGDEQKQNVWLHESGPQHMTEQMQSADQVSSSQVPLSENRSDNLCQEPSQHIANSYSSPLQANSNVTSNTWYQNNALQFPQNSDSFVANQSPHATFSGSRDGAQTNGILQQQYGELEQREKNSLPNVQSFNISDRFVGPNFSLLQQVNANARQQLFNLQSGAGNVGQGYTNVNSQLIFNSFGENKPMHSSSGFVGDQSGYSDPRNHPSVQKGPSWFQQHGTVKIGQMLPFSDSTHTTTIVSENIPETDSSGQKVISNASQVRSALPTSDIANATTPQLLGEKEQNFAELRPEKRKRVPWHEEVTQSSHSILELSNLAETLWEQTSSRLSQKMVADTETTWDVDLKSRAKKRLNLSTKLMQRIFRPAPAVVLSADASSNIDSVVYFTARFSLGDASGWANSASKPSDMPSKMPGASERDGRLDFPKYVESFNARAKKLEDTFSRLENTLSVAEIKLETQELEKYSVINRFAKYHRKVPSVSAEDPSSTTAAAAKPVPQRYVVALPMPNVVAEAVNCYPL